MSSESLPKKYIDYGDTIKGSLICLAGTILIKYPALIYGVFLATRDEPQIDKIALSGLAFFIGESVTRLGDENNEVHRLESLEENIVKRLKKD
ncbi:MAG TPA: hypothetical protein VJJ21_02995 [Candidatus Nanoarchaeia archaeon]|nr:hypothetical protein [Candidatus Nanoarchaeia archaeon]